MMNILTIDTELAIALSEGEKLIDDCLVRWESPMIGGGEIQRINIFQMANKYLVTFHHDDLGDLIEMIFIKGHLLGQDRLADLCMTHNIMLANAIPNGILNANIQSALVAYIEGKYK